MPWASRLAISSAVTTLTEEAVSVARRSPKRSGDDDVLIDGAQFQRQVELARLARLELQVIGDCGEARQGCGQAIGSRRRRREGELSLRVALALRDGFGGRGEADGGVRGGIALGIAHGSGNFRGRGLR